MGPTRPDMALRFDLRRGSSSSPATTSESDCVCVCVVDKLWRVCWKCVIKQTHAPTPLPARAPRSTDKKFMLRDVVAGELEICGEGRAPCSLPVARFGVRLSGPANGLAADDERGSVPSLQD